MAASVVSALHGVTVSSVARSLPINARVSGESTAAALASKVNGRSAKIN